MIARRDFFKQFIFGETTIQGEPLSAGEAEKILMRGREIREKLIAPSQDEILAVFSRLSKAWSDPQYQKRREALEALSKNSALSPEFIRVVLEEFPKMLDPEYLLRKIEGELGSRGVQGCPAAQKEENNIQLIVQPAGQVLHVASGNVFLACVESLIDGIITRNINFLKMSSDDRDFPIIFAESIREFDREGVISRRLAVIWWRGGDSPAEGLFKRGMDRIVFWGGREALASWENGLGESAVLVRHGPKISFGIISKAGLGSAELQGLTDNIALDIVIWEQKACNCPQMLFIEESVSHDELKKFVGSLAESLKKMNVTFPPGRRTDDEYVEVLKARELAMAEHLVTDKPVYVIGPAAFNWTIITEERLGERGFEPSPLNRTITIRRYRSLNALTDLFRPHASYLQTAGYCLGTPEISGYAVALSNIGVTRLCPFGIMAIPVAGTPHDGSYILRDLTRFTVVEH